MTTHKKKYPKKQDIVKIGKVPNNKEKGHVG